ncbi:MAG: HlyD family secretion protein [Bacteroidetes bacterium B1(2017)]|nr:MAG: HlyD family secretion protein [Bacteroidetes bacterium B1(2017)]
MKTNYIFIALIFLASCSAKKNQFDASGTFEAVETIVSAEAAGTLKVFTVEEGQLLSLNQNLGYIDSLQLFLKKKQLQSQVKAVLSKRPDIPAQLASLKEQLVQAEREQKRVENLFSKDAATQKQVDDSRSQTAIVRKQVNAMQSSLGISSTSITEETNPLTVQIAQLDDQLQKCRIVNPLAGTVLTKYAETFEMVSPGKPLYKIANMESLILRAYVSGDQFAACKLGQKVKVFIDSNAKEYKEYEGAIEWISNKAEFTPKTIQTKDERANLVYAIKVRVKNDGLLKLGMYGELKF